METYKWKIPGIFKDADPSKVKEEIDSLGDTVEPSDIVSFAENPNTELHKCFEWDDTEAARKYRISQARNVLRSLVVEVRTENKEPTLLRVRYVTEGKGYKSTELILSNQNEYDALLRRAKAELLAFREKYKSLNELEEVFDAIDEII